MSTYKIPDGTTVVNNLRVLNDVTVDGTINADVDTSASSFVLTQSAAPAPTAEGSVAWDTDDNKLVIGDGSGTKSFTDDSLHVLKSLYDAHTILYATSDNTPAALTVSASTFVGRKASGNISAMSVAEALTELGVSADTAQVLKADYDANTILAATADNTPAALTVDASTIVGRKATGDIVALTGAEARVIALGAQGAFIADPAGGGTIDAEARTAIVAILDVLIAAGIIAAA